MFVKSFQILNNDQECAYTGSIRETCYSIWYPFGAFHCNFYRTGIAFSQLTVFHGGNGSDKSTLLNLLAAKLGMVRNACINTSTHFNAYVKYCKIKKTAEIPVGSRVITSDDVFQHMFNLRLENEKIDKNRIQGFDEYYQLQDRPIDFDSYRKSNPELASKIKFAKRKKCSKSAFIRQFYRDNIRLCSNGESAFNFFCNAMRSPGLFLLDEPENSLSPAFQLDLCELLLRKLREGSQIVIATHSPILLSLPHATIYDLDADGDLPPKYERRCNGLDDDAEDDDDLSSVIDSEAYYDDNGNPPPLIRRKWTELENCRIYHAFFEAHRSAFK